MLTGLALMMILVIAIPSQFLFNDSAFQDQLYAMISSGAEGALLLFLALTVLSSIGLPRQISAFACGYSLGLIEGTLIATMAVTLGCWLTVTFSATFLKNFIKQRYPNQQQKIVGFLSEKLFYKAIVIRLLPIGSNFLTNLIVGVCDLNHKKFVSGSCIGFIPQMIIFTLAGTGVKLANNTHLIASVTLFIIAGILSLWLYKQHRIKYK